MMNLVKNMVNPANPLSSSMWQAWVSAVAPGEPHKMVRRLEWDGLDPASLQMQCSEEQSDVEGVVDLWADIDPNLDKAFWWPALQDCRDVLQASWDLPLISLQGHEDRPFVDLWWPIRELAAQRIQKWISAMPGEWIEAESIANNLADSLLQRLCSLGEKVLWECFSDGRNPGAVLLAHLAANNNESGSPAREYYEAFVRAHRRDGLEALLEKFPVLGRLLGRFFTLWHGATEELLHRIHADLDLLRSQFGIPQEYRLVNVTQGLSDPHRGGRVVTLLYFNASDLSPLYCGPSVDTEISASCQDRHAVRIAYKPKDMKLDEAYQAALKDLNGMGDLPPFSVLTVVPCDHYGYMEWVPHRPCIDDQELKEFYVHAGRLLAVLHLLGCTDCHHENLVASGTQLVLIDTETLLEPELPEHVKVLNPESSYVDLTQLQRRVRSSVVRSGLLPMWTVNGADQAFDISALGIESLLNPCQKRRGWLGINSDGMAPGNVFVPANQPASLPVPIGRVNPFYRHLDHFCAGFERQCLEFCRSRRFWLDPDGVLVRFRGLTRRIVLRSTSVYFAIQRQQLAPSALRSSFAQAMVLEKLARCFLLGDQRPLNWPVFAAEWRQMSQLDIPFFTHQVDGSALQLSEDNPGVEFFSARFAQHELQNFIKTSGVEAVRQRLAGFDGNEIEFQLRLIRGVAQARVLGSTPDSSDRDLAIAHADPLLCQTPASIDSHQAACRIAQCLLSLAIEDPDVAPEWLGVQLEPDGNSFHFGPVGTSLYSGSLGIACLLRCLARIDSKPAPGGSDLPDLFITSAERILQPLRTLVAESQPDWRLRWWRDQPLGINGCGGVLLTLQQLDETELVHGLLMAADRQFISQDSRLDLLSGCAGLVGMLLHQQGDLALQLALTAGERLLERQEHDGSWRLDAIGQGLLGFSHGASGFAAALARLHASTGDDRFLKAAESALAYERRHFDGQKRNWPDFRTGGNVGDSVASWCHGAPGIALGRACLWGTSVWDDLCLEEIELALLTTADYKNQSTDHLCCGSLGLMAILEMVGEGPWPLSASIREICKAAAQSHRDRALERCGGDPSKSVMVDLRCLSSGGGSWVEPGFFVGLSGMGLALLRDARSRSMFAQLFTAGLWPL